MAEGELGRLHPSGLGKPQYTSSCHDLSLRLCIPWTLNCTPTIGDRVALQSDIRHACLGSTSV